MRTPLLRQWCSGLRAAGLCLVSLAVPAYGSDAPGATGAVPFEPPFEWSAPEGCPSRAAALEVLPLLLDVEPASWNRFERVRGEIRPKRGAWELELEFSAGQRVGRRVFTTRDCADLAHAAAVALALVLDPSWDWSPEPAGGGNPTPERGPDSPDPDSDVARERTPIASEVSRGAGRIGLAVGVDGVLDATTFGQGVFGIGVLGRADFAPLGGAFGAELFGIWLPSQAIQVRAGESVELGLLAAGARGCFSVQAAIGLCGDLELGRLAANGVGLDEVRAVDDLWIAPGSSILLSTVVEDLVVRMRVAVLVPLVRPEYFVNRTEGVHEVPDIALRVTLGAALPIF